MNRFNGIEEVYCALYVDFDNIFTRLYELDPELAHEFGSNPKRWIRWIEGHAVKILYGEGVRRRILKRVCYLNPRRYQEYRSFFTMAAFQVVDCPPMTRQEKTSTDIHLVMDCLDALQHQTHFGEFIILSGDSDFTPLLLRLQEHARKTLVLSVGYTSPAYAAAATWRIREDWFITQSLEKEAMAMDDGYHDYDMDGDMDNDMADMHSSMRSSYGRGRAHDFDAMDDADDTDIEDDLNQHFQSEQNYTSQRKYPRMHHAKTYRSDFDDRQKSFHGLSKPSLNATGADNVVDGDNAEGAGHGDDGDNGGNGSTSYAGNTGHDQENAHEQLYRPRIIQAAPAMARRVEQNSAAQEEPSALAETKYVGYGQDYDDADDEGVNGNRAPAQEEVSISEKAATILKKIVMESAQPVPAANIGQILQRELGAGLDWFGFGKLRDFLDHLDLEPLEFSPVPPGYLFDPEQHERPEERGNNDEFKERYPELFDFALNVHRLTDMPMLLPEHYKQILGYIVEEVNQNGFFMTTTSRNVRDKCLESGLPVARSHVNFVIVGVGRGGCPLNDKQGISMRDVAKAFLRNAYELCRMAQMELGEHESHQLMEWIMPKE